MSAEAKDLISKLLVPEKERLNTDQIKNHDWLNKFLDTDDTEIPGEITDKLKEFRHNKNLKKTVLTYLASRVKDQDIKLQSKVFEMLDKDHNGYINLKELVEGF